MADTLKPVWTGTLNDDGSPSLEKQPGADYRLNYGDKAEKAAEHFGALDREFRSAFAQTGIPQHNAQPLLDAILSGMDKHDSSMTHEQAVEIREAEMSKLNKLHDCNDVLHYAKIAYQRLPAEFISMLNEFSSLDTADAYVALANVGRSLSYQDYRAGRR
jgi:hypothetical protein